mmetsp:Transcript_129037/g.413425  ORF Transcript_129037/g.413425 Transcript_129037/m.413425 type:complete len:1143 (-) Transcript_129037:43-3471(-)
MQQQGLQLKAEWAGFDLVRVGAQVPVTYARNELFIISGCITTTTPTKNQAGWPLTIGGIDPRCAPSREISFLAPTAMSRYEGMNQCGTSMTLTPDGRLQIFFNKNTNPMVLHMSGFCCCISREDPIEIPVAAYSKQDWFVHSKGKPGAESAPEAPQQALQAEPFAPLGLQRCGNIVCLQGQLRETMFGPTSLLVAVLPKGLRPLRELRWLAALIKIEENNQYRVLDHSVAVTLKPDGRISVQGGKVHMVDPKGQMRVYQQNKKGHLCLDGIRFSLVDGKPIELSKHLGDNAKEKAKDEAKAKVSYLVSDGLDMATAVVIKQGDVTMLEGHLRWSGTRPPNAKQPVASLPEGCWPRRREVFFTRGGSDLEERRRVDVDQWGRIFCPEGVSDGRVELTGIIYVCAEPTSGGPASQPRDPEWDDLKLQYQRNDVSVVSTSFDGHELLEQFVRRSNYHEWRFVEYDFGRHAGRKMLLPLGSVPLRGHDKWDPMNLHTDRNQKFWKDYKQLLTDQYGITAFHTLLHISDDLLAQVEKRVRMRPDDLRYLHEYRSKERQTWALSRQSGMTYNYLEQLASEIADQMFEHWDFKAQLQGALQNDFRPPATIEHLFPQRRNGQDWVIRKTVKDHEMAKFEEIRQFFFLYETTGSNMTHCSLMGSSDIFTTTGKWHFPDSPDVQKQLFENIAWLFPKKIYLYISERQTQRFPFIEDFDVQAPKDWQGPLPDGQVPRPPDELIMDRPIRVNGKVEGDPGELMKQRAIAIHMIYPHIETLEALVYSASGFNKGKDMLKSSFHLVWPQLIVDPDRAPVIRHVTLGLFRKETMTHGSYLQECQRRLINLHESNSWELVFDSTTINARNGLRLPYSDKASMVIADPKDKQKIKDGLLSKTQAFKKRVKEDRPSIAVGKIHFTFDRDPTTGASRLDSAKWVADEQSYSVAEWIGAGTCRRDPNNAVLAELTAWQLGPEVLAMLPTKPGEQWDFAEGEDDGEGGHWVTHKPFPQIRRCDLSIKEFQRNFNEALGDEQDQLRDEQNIDFLRRTVGSWVSVTEGQAIWRAAAAGQCESKAPDHFWHYRVGPSWRQSGSSGPRAPDCHIVRPAEVIFLKRKGKVIIDGPSDVVEALLRPLKTFTKPDDNALMPIYDVVTMSK